MSQSTPHDHSRGVEHRQTSKSKVLPFSLAPSSPLQTRATSSIMQTTASAVLSYDHSRMFLPLKAETNSQPIDGIPLFLS